MEDVSTQNLKGSEDSKHVYHCDQNTGSSNAVSLNKESTHDGARYPCDQFELAAT